MLHFFLAISAAVLLGAVDAQSTYNYTVHSTVIFARTGEREPVLGALTSPELTSTGAQQLSNLGSFFRERYITGSGEGGSYFGPTSIKDISRWRVDNDQVYISTTDEQYMAASAQAFMQSLYPPYTLNNATAPYLDPSSVITNDSYMGYLEYPLHGYQYARIHSASIFDPNYLYIRGDENCPNYVIAANKYYHSAEFNVTNAASLEFYGSLGPDMLSEVLPSIGWSFYNGYNIYEYIAYQARHNATIHAVLRNDPSIMSNLHALASSKQYGLNANLSASNSQIRAIAGRTAAAKMLGQLQRTVATRGFAPKISLIVGEFEPFVALFSLLSLQELNSNFYALPDFGSALVFELFSIDSGSNDSDGWVDDDLRVRFYFRNGTEEESTASDGLQAYPIFGRGPQQTDIRWAEFEIDMANIMLADVGDWCDTCSSGAVFCPAFDDYPSSSSRSSRSHSSLNPAAAGGVGAVVALLVAGLIFAAAMLLGGVRFHHKPARGKKSSLGGFKGGAKLASDTDLVVPKGGAMVSDDKKDHERIGSWEMGNKVQDVGVRDANASPRSRPSFDMDEETLDITQKPTRPDERV